MCHSFGQIWDFSQCPLYSDTKWLSTGDSFQEDGGSRHRNDWLSASDLVALSRRNTQKGMFIFHRKYGTSNLIAVALVRAAEALKSRKYGVFIAATRGDDEFVKEIVSFGLNVMICPALPFVEKEEWFWIASYDVVLVNTFPMIRAAYEIARRRPVLWWMHESRHTYESVLYRCSDYLNVKIPHFLHIFSVSESAKKTLSPIAI